VNVFAVACPHLALGSMLVERCLLAFDEELVGSGVGGCMTGRERILSIVLPLLISSFTHRLCGNPAFLPPPSVLSLLLQFWQLQEDARELAMSGPRVVSCHCFADQWHPVTPVVYSLLNIPNPPLIFGSDFPVSFFFFFRLLPNF